MNIWQIIYRSTWVALLALMVVGTIGMFLPKWREYNEFKRRKAEAEDRIRVEEDMVRILQTRQQRFLSDPDFVVQVAHDLGLARSNEVVFKYREEIVPATPAAAPAATNHRIR